MSLSTIEQKSAYILIINNFCCALSYVCILSLPISQQHLFIIPMGWEDSWPATNKMVYIMTYFSIPISCFPI